MDNDVLEAIAIIGFTLSILNDLKLNFDDIEE